MKKMKLLLILTSLTLLFSMSFAQDIQIHGFISQGAIYSTEYNYIASNSKDLSLDLQEIGVNFQTDVSDRLHIGMQLLSRDVGVYGEGRVTVDWAYGDYYVNDALQIAFGRVKNRLGFYTTIQDFDFLRTWAVLPSALYDMGLRTINSTVDGLQIHGNIDTDLAGSLDYALTYGTMKLGSNSDLAAYVGQLTTEPIEAAKTKFNFSANVIYNTPVDGLRLNGTYSRIEQFAFDPIHQSLDLSQMGMGIINFNYNIETDIDAFYFGGQYMINNLEVTVEYNMGTRHLNEYMSGIDKAILQAIGQAEPNKYDTDYGGGYFGVAYRLNQKLSLGGYYQMYVRDKDLNDNDPRKNANDAALSLAFYPGYNMVIKLEGHYVDGLGGLSVALNDTFDEEIWMYGVAKVSYNF